MSWYKTGISSADHIPVTLHCTTYLSLFLGRRLGTFLLLLPTMLQGSFPCSSLLFFRDQGWHGCIRCIYSFLAQLYLGKKEIAVRSPSQLQKHSSSSCPQILERRKLLWDINWSLCRYRWHPRAGEHQEKKVQRESQQTTATNCIAVHARANTWLASAYFTHFCQGYRGPALPLSQLTLNKRTFRRNWESHLGLAH